MLAWLIAILPPPNRRLREQACYPAPHAAVA
jgi:hypothetical protein